MAKNSMDSLRGGNCRIKGLAAIIFTLVVVVEVNGGNKKEATNCLTDTHIQCGELIVWNDTQSPASTILQLTFPEHFDATGGWSVHLSTCHDMTTASTTLKLFDACPVTADSGPFSPDPPSTSAGGGGGLGSTIARSAVASNTRDRSCKVADRSSSLSFEPRPGFHAPTPDTYFAVATAGARVMPESNSLYSVALFLTCSDANGHEIRAHSWQPEGSPGAAALGGGSSLDGSGAENDRFEEARVSGGVDSGGTPRGENPEMRFPTQQQQQQQQQQERAREQSREGAAGAGSAPRLFSRELSGTSPSPTTSPAPTTSQAPSSSPTSGPSPGPTATQNPSVSPTAGPSPGPTASLNPTSPTQTPTATGYPTLAPTPDPSPVPSPPPTPVPSGPTPLPTLVPLPEPSPLPTSTLPPTVTPAPTPLPTQDHCGVAGVASCGSIVQGDTTGRFGYTGEVAGEANFLIPASTPRTVKAAACPTAPAASTGNSTGSSELSDPALRLYTGCPFQGGVEVANSANTTAAAVLALQAELGGSSNFSSVNLTGCAVVTHDVHAGYESASGYWAIVDGASPGSEGAFELSVLCNLIFYPSPEPTGAPTSLPSIQPSPAPSATPRPSQVPVLAPTPRPSTPPSPAPTQVHARSNCACFSGKMIENIGTYCPRLLAHLSEGCMSNVTRAVLKEYSANCTALKADWGPFFQFADDDGGTIPGYPNYS